MHILVLNAGSSSVKASVIEHQTGKHVLTMAIERIDEAHPVLRLNGEVQACPGPGHAAALAHALPLMANKLNGTQLAGIGHRVVHGGDRFSHPVRITDEVEQTIEELSPLAPLHNPVNLEGIRIAKHCFPDLPHIAVFDTAFHQTLPRRARHYALPAELSEKYGLRRYGFHGTSHRYVAQMAADYLQTDLRNLRLITCHLGNGASMTAIEYGRSVETSMGMTPLEGLVMGTRVGDIDPGILLRLLREEDISIDDLDRILNHESGLKGISKHSNDMRDIIERAANGDEDCRMALHAFCHRIRKYIGAYAAVMDGVDAIVFTGGIGENSPTVRNRVTQRLDFLGALLWEDKNRDVQLNAETPVVDFARPHSRVRLLAVATDEALSIARQTAKLVNEKDRVNIIPEIPIAISARHVHLDQATVEKLFGEGHELTVRNYLSQPGQFACEETVTLVGPRNRLEKVRVLGPVRSVSQVEVSRTDEFFLGIDAPVRASGKIENTPGITLEGPAGRVDLKEGLICAWRHIHMTPEDAEIFEVVDKDIVEVEVRSEQRSLTFGNVLVRVSDKYKLEMHIDTDEGNAAEIRSGATGALVAGEGKAFLKRKRLR